MDDPSPATSQAASPTAPPTAPATTFPATSLAASPARRRRDRHGRGMRGPAILPRTPGQPELPTDRERFDALALDIVTGIDERWQDRLGLVEYAVEDAPQIPDDWAVDTVPLSSLVRGTGATPTRLVLFRRPIEHRAETRSDLEAMILTVVVEQVAELLGIDAELVDPRYSRPE